MLIQSLLLAVSAAFAAAQVGSPCDTVRCMTNLTCVLASNEIGTCFVAPCPQLPVCVPIGTTCDDDFTCAEGEQCIMRQVTCVMAPCYPIRECVKQPKCGTNEVYNECSRGDSCPEPSCTDTYPICTAQCGPGKCECAPGFVRLNGTCIDPTTCPDPECGAGEKWDKCPTDCPENCRIFRGKQEAEMCTAACGVPRCTCAEGFVLNDDHKCIKKDDCPTEFPCEENEEWVECSSHCEPTCDNRSPTCIESCGPAKCQCKATYVRDNGRCIFGPQCPLEGAKSRPFSPRPGPPQ